MPSCRWVVSGRVQGVGFRWFVLREAQRFQVNGWVRNLPDGRVEVCAHGNEPELRLLGEAIARGPRFAAVDHVEKLESSRDVELYNSFEIR